VIVHPTKAYLLRDYTQLMAHLDHAREDQGLTRQQLADETPGVSRSQVTEWLNGKHEAGGSKAFALANALGYDLALIPREGA
jgi:transcriptional regulator with XRE-family HTH domain